MDKYIVITASGLDVFSGSMRECNAYLKQALKKGSVPGFLAIAPSDVCKTRDLYVVLNADNSFRILTASGFRRLGKKFWLHRCFFFCSSSVDCVNDHMRLWLKYPALGIVEISDYQKSLIWPGFCSVVGKDA